MSVFDNAKFIINENNGSVRWHGVETGDLFIHATFGDYLILKEKGGQHWVSRGEQKYSGARLWVWRLNANGRYDHIADFPVVNKNDPPCGGRHWEAMQPNA